MNQSLLIGIVLCAGCAWRAPPPRIVTEAAAEFSGRAPGVSPVGAADSELAGDPADWAEEELASQPDKCDSDAVIRLPPVDSDSAGSATPERQCLFDDLWDDHRHFYGWRSLGALAGGVGVAAVMANTSMDENFRHTYQENIRSASTDEYSEALHTPKILGNGAITLPVFAGTALVGSWFEEGTAGHGLGQWGERSLRTALVGAPPMLALQYATGGSRPHETADSSSWRPFQDANGVSGHSFMGAVPFLAAAKMAETPFWKAAFYTGSTLPALSRINDESHYASQALLGWWIAYLAATAVDRTADATEGLVVGPMPVGDQVGLGVEIRR